MRVLALDIGKKRTGVAFVDTENDIPLPLDTIVESSTRRMVQRVVGLAEERMADLVVIGLPLLLSGSEGSQSSYVRGCADLLEKKGLTITFLDERYTTSKHTSFDGDARAACELLQMFLESR